MNHQNKNITKCNHRHSAPRWLSKIKDAIRRIFHGERRRKCQCCGKQIWENEFV